MLNGWGVGETHLGAYAERARVNGDWLVPLPPSFSPAEAMAIGTAGYTAQLSVLALERHGADARATAGGRHRRGRRGRLGRDRAAEPARLARRGLDRAARRRPDFLKELGAAEIIAPRRTVGARQAARQGALGRRHRCGRLDDARQPPGADRARMARSRPAASRAAWTCRPPWRRSSCAASRCSASTASMAPRAAAARSLVAPRPRSRPRQARAASPRTIGFDDIIPTATEILDGTVRGRVVVEIA